MGWLYAIGSSSSAKFVDGIWLVGIVVKTNATFSFWGEIKSMALAHIEEIMQRIHNVPHGVLTFAQVDRPKRMLLWTASVSSMLIVLTNMIFDIEILEVMYVF